MKYEDLHYVIFSVILILWVP